jgi:hypothetical protein
VRLRLAGAALALGCARQAPPPPPPAPPPPPLTEESLAPSTTAEFQIGPIKETASTDGAAVFVEGTVRNVGSRPSRDVKVSVEGLDSGGTRVVSADTLPTPQAIAPGTSATFVVRLPNDPAVRTYHVVAIGR